MNLDKLFHLKENHTDVKTESHGWYHYLYDNGLHPGGKSEHPVRIRNGPGFHFYSHSIIRIYRNLPDGTSFQLSVRTLPRVWD